MFTPTTILGLEPLQVEYLVVAGGGAAGNNYAGGGGAGGLLSGSMTINPYTTLPIFVGGGGMGRGGTITGLNGLTSSLDTISTVGGGGGAYTSYFTSNVANSGGSGGGGGAARQVSINYGAGTSGQGFRGGNGGTQATNGTPGGGGGASAVGQAGVNSASGKAGDGGAGSQWLDTTYYAGGGAGANYLGTVEPQGGIGGGGNGNCSSCSPAQSSTDGTDFLGGGGGANGSRGGSGVVKIRYAGEPNPYIKGGTVSQSDGYTYHTFTNIEKLYYQSYDTTTWDPSDFSNVQYWWRADMGITEAGTGVSVWEDQINSFQLVQGTDGNRPSLTTDGSLNGVDVVSFNGTSDYLYSTSTAAARTGDWSFLVVYNLVNTRTGGSIFSPAWYNVGTGRAWLDTLNGVIRGYNQGFGDSAGRAYTIKRGGTVEGVDTAFFYYQSNPAKFSATVKGVRYSNGSEAGNNNQGWYAGSTVCMGASVDGTGGSVFGGRYVEANVAEVVMIYGKPSDDELTRWVNYVRERYGEIL
jgi:hypothetical protein